MLDLSVVFLIGLLGSAHCVGMCGGFVATLGHAGGRGGVHTRQSAYFLGKTTTYALFGALAGLAGDAIGIALSGFQGLLTLALGLVLVGVGLATCGALRRVSGPGRWTGRFAASIGGALRVLLQRGGFRGLFGLGALNGLLPCGLVYAMLAKAGTTGSALDGALTLAVFGLATIPALYVTGLAGAWLPPARRVWMQRVGGVFVLGLGLLTMARAATAMALLDPSGLPVFAQDLLCRV